MNYNPIKILIDLNDIETIDRVKKTYQKYRDTVWSNEKIDNMLNSLENDLFSSGAYIRDNKWNIESEYSDLDKFKSYVINRFNYMDLYIDSL